MQAVDWFLNNIRILIILKFVTVYTKRSLCFRKGYCYTEIIAGRRFYHIKYSSLIDINISVTIWQIKQRHELKNMQTQTQLRDVVM
jgi:hypothetical protein